MLTCKELLLKFRQNHLLEHLASLAPDELQRFEEQVQRLDLERYFVALAQSELNQSLSFEGLKPQSYVSALGVSKNSITLGCEALGRGEVGFLVVAGGQGSRLGFEHPKGMFPAAPVTSKSLFQLFCEKIVAAGEFFGFEPHFFVMVSRSNHDETKSFLEENHFFGLRRDSVHLFEQGMLPAVDQAGRLLLSSRTTLFEAPDGHGGVLRALRASGMLDCAEQLGIRCLSYFQIDNPMVEVADVGFLGNHFEQGAQISTKVIRKRDGLEKLGNPVILPDGSALIVEYSDFPETLAMQQAADGSLVYPVGSIGVHLLDVSFIRSLTASDFSLPYHRAVKAIPFFDFALGSMGMVEHANGIKLEQFVFDAIRLATSVSFYETERAREFAPLKNRSGEDSIGTCREVQIKLFREWFLRAGITVSADAEIEISPLFAFSFEEFEKKIGKFLLRCPKKLYLE